MATLNDSTPKQPIHPSMLSRLDPEYVAFHNKHILHLPPQHTLPWSPKLREGPIFPGGSKPLPVGKIQDYNLTHAKVRVYTPDTNAPETGYPVLVYFHGGGWTLGNISSEGSLATNMCVHANCVVVYVSYRLAPENPYPAAVEDATEALNWVYKNGRDILDVNTNRIAVGGSSSGGNLAAIVSLKAAEAQPPIPLVFQLLIVPVTDNSASVETFWAENKLTTTLSPERMMWFRNNYLPNKEDWTKWDASPIFAPEELLSKVPKAWIGVAEADILRDEGIAYGERLRKAGISVEIEIFKGAPHPVMILDGVALEVGRKLVKDAGNALKAAFEAE